MRAASSFHALDYVGLIAVVLILTLARRHLYWSLRFAMLRAHRRWMMLVDWALGPNVVKAGEKSLPFFVAVTMPEADYLAVVTFRPYLAGRTRWIRRRVTVRAQVTMQPGEAIPLPPPHHRTGRRSDDAVYSLMLPHAASLDDASAQMARYAMALRARRASAEWAPAGVER